MSGGFITYGLYTGKLNIPFINNINIDLTEEELEVLDTLDEICTLDFSKNEICTGETFTATLEDGSYTHCYIFAGTEAIYEGWTDSEGIWQEDITIHSELEGDLIGFCDKDDSGTISDGDCRTNAEHIKIENCPDPTDGYEDGDVVGGISGENTFSGAESITIDLSDLTEGNCGLKALIQYDWHYVDEDACRFMGVNGWITEGILLELDDSSGTAWESYETSPNSGVGVETECELIWDGVNDWKFSMSRIHNIEGCEININYDIDILTCNCQD